jgi:hypothetical protein
MASISGCQSSMRGTINQCKAAVASSINVQNPRANQHNQRIKLTYQRRPVAAALKAVACSVMQNKAQVEVTFTMKLSPASDFDGKIHL